MILYLCVSTPSTHLALSVIINPRSPSDRRALSHRAGRHVNLTMHTGVIEGVSWSSMRSLPLKWTLRDGSYDHLVAHCAMLRFELEGKL